MLHIILVILKIVGMILGAILLLLLLAVLLLLFAPLRYRVEVRYGPEDYGGRASVGWLGKLIWLEASFEKSGGLRASLKAAGVKLFGIPKEEKPGDQPPGKKRAKKKSGRAAGNGKSRGQGQAGRKPKELPEKPQVRAGAGKKSGAGASQADAAKRSGDGMSQATAGKAKEPAAKPPTQTKELRTGSDPVKKIPDKAGSAPGAEKPPAQESAPDTAKQPKTEPQNSLAARLLAPLKTHIGTLRRLYEKLKQIPEKLRAIQKKLKQTGKRLEALKNRLNAYLEILKDDETRNLFKDLKGHASCLWKHYRPRKAAGRLHFGFEDPSLTGQAAGILYLLFSSPGNDIAISPEFDTEEMILDGNLTISGRIRFCHAVKVGFSLLFNKDLRAFLKRIRNVR